MSHIFNNLVSKSNPTTTTKTIHQKNLTGFYPGRMKNTKS